MSITKDFEQTAMAHGLPMYKMKEVDDLLTHARALEAMLKKHEFVVDEVYEACVECGMPQHSGHSKDCELAKLLDGVN